VPEYEISYSEFELSINFDFLCLDVRLGIV